MGDVVDGDADSDRVADNALDLVLFHLAGKLGCDNLPALELHQIMAATGRALNDTFELRKIFFRHLGAVISPLEGVVKPEGTGRSTLERRCTHEVLELGHHADARGVLEENAQARIDDVGGAVRDDAVLV